MKFNNHKHFDRDRMTDAQLAKLPTALLSTLAQGAVYTRNDAMALRLGMILRKRREAAIIGDLRHGKPWKMRIDPDDVMDLPLPG